MEGVAALVSGDAVLLTLKRDSDDTVSDLHSRDLWADLTLTLPVSGPEGQVPK